MKKTYHVISESEDLGQTFATTPTVVDDNGLVEARRKAMVHTAGNWEVIVLHTFTVDHGDYV